MAADQGRAAHPMKAPMMQTLVLEMLKLLDDLADYSTSEEGITRLLYTPEWSGAQRFLQEKMAELGLNVTIDQVGNVIGRLNGRNVEAKTIVTGSHVDTVVSGGKYDGAYGIAASLAAIHYLQQAYGVPKRTIAVISFCEEEGSRFPLTFWGSGNITGLYDGSEADSHVDSSGITLRAAMTECELGNELGITNPMCSTLREEIGTFVELHIEQGNVLENEAVQIGIVQAIAGQRRFKVKVCGTANHAGTTPMYLRKDALAGTAEMLLLLERSAGEAGEPLVATSGHLEVIPGTPNVIPGEVQFTLDIRHSKAVELEHFCESVLADFYEIAQRRGLTIEHELILRTAPALMDPELTQVLEHICQQQNKSSRSIVSGAGHDAQLFAPQYPTAMIFVPSRDGISHSPLEYSSPEDLAAGLEVLTEFLYELAYK